VMNLSASMAFTMSISHHESDIRTILEASVRKNGTQ